MGETLNVSQEKGIKSLLSFAKAVRLWVGGKYIRILHRASPHGNLLCGAQGREVSPAQVDAICGVCWGRYTLLPRRVAHRYVSGELLPSLPRYLSDYVFVPIELEVGEEEDPVLADAPPLPMGDAEVEAVIARYIRETGSLRGALSLWEAHKRWREANALSYVQIDWGTSSGGLYELGRDSE